jgi:SWI/SNF-related matrix-associated actin-dependent regulator 1 of chromatin subfamily A
MVELLPYQRVGVDAIHARNCRVLLADEQGLGKTIQTLVLLKEANLWPACVVCPAGLKRHWAREAATHVDIGSVILDSTTPHGLKEIRQAAEQKQLLIINYDILGSWLPFLQSLKLQLLGADECHLLANMGSRRSRAFWALAQGVPGLLFLSGTPLVAKPWQLYPVLSMLDPERWNSPFSFGMEFCADANRNYGRWQFSGAKNMHKLHRILKESVMILRTAKEVLPDLPPLRRSVVLLDVADLSEYREAETDLIAWIAKTDMGAAWRAARAERWVRCTRLKQLAAALKLPAAMVWLDCQLAASDSKLLVGTMHKAVMEVLLERYGHIAVHIDGSCSQKQRQEAEDKIRHDDDTRILFGQQISTGLGLNLPEVRTVVSLELPWSPGLSLQFEKRTHRLTSTQPVNSYYLAAAQTIEERIFKILQKKMEVLDQILDGVLQREDSLNIYDLLAEELRKAV